MKKIFAWMMAISLIFSLTACGGGSSSSSTTGIAETTNAGTAVSSESVEATTTTESTTTSADTKISEATTASITTTSESGESQASSSNAEITIKMAHNVTIGGTEDQAAQKFAELVNEKTNGTVEVQVYGGGQLGDETELLEGLQLGTIDAAMCTSAYISNIVPQFQILDLPFLFSDVDDVKAKLEGEVGETLKQKLLDEQNIRVLGYFSSGFRIMLTKSAPITSLADIKNRKMRAPEVPIYIDMFKALGAAPTPIPFGEVYTSINTNVVDGVEVCAEEMYTMKFHEVGKYIAKTNHIFSTMIPLIREDVFEKLNEEQKNAVLEAATEAVDWEWEAFTTADEEALKKMEDAGIEVNELTDRDDWVSACTDLQDEYATKCDGTDLLEILRQ